MKTYTVRYSIRDLRYSRKTIQRRSLRIQANSEAEAIDKAADVLCRSRYLAFHAFLTSAKAC